MGISVIDAQKKSENFGQPHQVQTRPHQCHSSANKLSLVVALSLYLLFILISQVSSSLLPIVARREVYFLLTRLFEKFIGRR